MSKKKQEKKIKRNDYNRVLVTETLPFETPVIFSNDGLYDCIVKLNSATTIQKKIIKALVFGDGVSNINSTIPYLYKIRKNSKEFRRLALLHPSSQWRMVKFYEKYEHLILYHCSQSPASIRAPFKIAGTFYFKNSSENLNQYKTENLSLLSLDDITKHSPSFYAYKGYNRLYKFFESHDYFELEKKYEYMRTLDVSRCFDSIYTHSMSWAIKDKEFTKKHVSVSATFAQQFDALMCHANYNETNGIVIGPEISRIFAEIIFQEIDIRVIQRLKEPKHSTNVLSFGKEYCFRRYVDDVYIFAISQDIANSVYEAYADILVTFNLHVNQAKSIEIHRPFVTNKSRLIKEVSDSTNNFIEKFLYKDKDGQILIPKEIHSKWRLTRSAIDKIKVLCSHNQVNFDEVSTYLISIFTERIKRIVAASDVRVYEENAAYYCDSLRVLLEILFFLYQVSPSVSASYKLSTSIILITRFVRKYLTTIDSIISLKIFELTETLLFECQSNNSKYVDNLIPLEILNIVLAVRELGNDYLLPEDLIRSLFIDNRDNSYFNIVSCLYYIRDEPCYHQSLKQLLDSANTKLDDLSDIRMNAEKTYLLLDLLACPYLGNTYKKSWLSKTFKALDLPQPDKAEINAYLNSSKDNFTHIDWKDVDLLRSLEKKELKQAY